MTAGGSPTASAVRWEFPGAYWQQVSITSAGLVFFHLPTQPNTLTNVILHLEGSVGHGDLPAGKPSLSVVNLPIATGTEAVTVAAVQDTSGNTTSYETPHTIDIGTISVDLSNAANMYYIKVIGESGVNSQINLRLYAIQCTFEPN
jgi:hypothetical protein